jgi:hypothetical protein
MSLLDCVCEVLSGVGSDRFAAEIGIGVEDERGSEVMIEGRGGWLDKRGSVGPGGGGGGGGGGRGGASISIMLIEYSRDV